MQQKMKAKPTIDPEEIARFSRIAEEWWDPHGKFKPLHRMNPLRVGYIRDHICKYFERDSASIRALEGLRLLDIGCGGGLISEPMARMGAEVTGIDASEKNIAVAQLHAEQSGVNVRYRAAAAEELAAEGAQYDVVLALEIIEHVADVPAFMDAAARLLAPGGLLVMSTLNRTAKSFALAIVGAEYVLRWLPRGTHDWRKFLRPSELAAEFRRVGLELVDQKGMVMSPFTFEWRLDARDLEVNYLQTAKKPR